MNIVNAIGNAEIVKMFFGKTGIKLNYLISYQYLKGQAYKLVKLYRHMIALLFLDSGAYSYSKGISKITLSEFSLYFNRYGTHFDEVFSFDQDFLDPEVNLRNQLYLVKNLPAGRKPPIPVIHDPHDPFGELKSYQELGYSYVAIGSTQRIKDDVFKRIKEEYPDLKLHMFGTLNRKMLMTHRPYSADSTGYAQAAARGSILYWHPGEKKEYQIDVGERDKNDAKIPHFKKFKYRREVEEFLFKTFNYEYRDLLVSTDAKWLTNCYFFKQLEDYINSLP